jgi:hypothetical protein
MRFKPKDILLYPFPYADHPNEKVRPVLFLLEDPDFADDGFADDGDFLAIQLRAL